MNKYSFLIADGTGFLLLKTMEGETFEEAKMYFTRQLHEYYSVVTDEKVIKSFIKKENENKFLCEATKWFYEALDQLEAQLKETESIKVNNKLEAAEKINEMEQEANVLKRAFAETGDETLLIQANYIESDVYNLELEAVLF
ncbi:hypothetical protein OCE50_27790 [Bacillus wiedmannii]|uniref:hypothetical protein n=1 Tax=Bacillus wiedmannii TaxID=1890302 RepID=UPI0021D347DE|nr:hypothetical protein [Bacillus wiedmannii]MCU5414670.1 hypothetical protein [Bacillus wiedmannii]